MIPPDVMRLQVGHWNADFGYSHAAGWKELADVGQSRLRVGRWNAMESVGWVADVRSGAAGSLDVHSGKGQAEREMRSHLNRKTILVGLVPVAVEYEGAAAAHCTTAVADLENDTTQGTTQNVTTMVTWK